MDIRMLQTTEEYEQYATFGYAVYSDNPYWVPPNVPHLVNLLSGNAAGDDHFQVQAFWAEEGDNGRILATVTAMIDNLYNRHWQEHMGHLFFFEALPGTDAAVKLLFESASAWLRERGCTAARLSSLYGWQNPLTIDAYADVPTIFHTYNPPYYHGYIKQAGFVTEKGESEYQVAFTGQLAHQYAAMVERVTRSGVTLRPWDFAHLEAETARFADLYNTSFATHPGAPPMTLPQLLGLTVGLKDFLVPDFTVFAEAEGQVVGGVFALPNLSQALHPLRHTPEETYMEEFIPALTRITHGVLLIIGVRPEFQGRGISQALAAQSYRAMIQRGYTSASYTTVADTNAPSRRTAEKLGARATRNFVVYRQELGA